MTKSELSTSTCHYFVFLEPSSLMIKLVCYMYYFSLGAPWAKCEMSH